jgi:hypothetical protein
MTSAGKKGCQRVAAVASIAVAEEKEVMKGGRKIMLQLYTGNMMHCSLVVRNFSFPKS